MALAGTTLLAEALFPATTSSFNTSNLTTVSGELLVVIVGFNEFNGTTDPTADLTIANTGTALTFTQRAIEGSDVSFSRGIVVWTAPVTTGATIQLTLDCGARNVRRCMVHCESYSGYDTGSPVGTTGEDSDTTFVTSSYSFNLGTNPASTSEVIASVLSDGWTSVTHGTGWTEVSDVGSSGNLGMGTQVRSGSTSTTVLFDATTGGGYATGVAVEIKESSGTNAAATTASATGTANNATVATGVLYKDLIDGVEVAPGTSSAQSDAFTPTGDRLLIAVVGMLQAALSDQSGTMTIADSQGLTWTSINNGVGETANGLGLRAWISTTAPTATSTTITMDAGATDVYGYHYSVFEVAATDGTIDGYTESAASTANGSHTVTLAATPTANDVVVYARFATDGTLDMAAGWDVLANTNDTVDFTGALGVTVNPSLTSTSIEVDDASVGSAADAAIHLGFIIRPASTATNANATAASSTGTANVATTTVAPSVGTASSTGTANNATVTTAVAVAATAATSTGTANNATITSAVVGTATAASSTGTANVARASVAPSISAASATGTANNATATASEPSWILAEDGNAILDETSDPLEIEGDTTSANATAASSTGTANNATVTTAVAATATAATSTGTANNATVTTAVAATATAATSTGTANNATVTVAGADTILTEAGEPLLDETSDPLEIEGGTSATATAATGTGTANTATTQVAPSVGVASATGTAVNPAVTTSGGANPTALSATGTGTANSATTTVAPSVTAASSTGTANNPTVTVGTSVNALPAIGTGVALSPSVALLVTAALATALAVANAATADTGIPPSDGIEGSPVTYRIDARRTYIADNRRTYRR